MLLIIFCIDAMAVSVVFHVSLSTAWYDGFVLMYVL